jgi:hypothetical protein
VNITVLWDVMRYRVVRNYHCFEGICCSPVCPEGGGSIMSHMVFIVTIVSTSNLTRKVDVALILMDIVLLFLFVFVL